MAMFSFGPRRAVDPMQLAQASIPQPVQAAPPPGVVNGLGGVNPMSIEQAMSYLAPTQAAQAPGLSSDAPSLNAVGGQGWEPNIIERLQYMFDIPTRDDQIAERNSQQRRAALSAELMARLKRMTGSDDREFLAYMANTPEWGKAVSSNYAAENLKPGETLARPGYGATTVPMFGIDGGRGYAVGPSGVANWSADQRPMSYNEEAQIALKQADLERKKAADANDDSNAKQRIAISRTQANKPAGGGRPALGGHILPGNYRPR